MCKRHWYMLPKAMRDAVWREYQPGQERGDAPVTAAYCEVTDQAIRYLVELEAKDNERKAEAAGQLTLFPKEKT